MRLVENAHKKNGNFNGAIQINSIESTLVVLGYGAIFINFIFNFLLLVLFISKANPSLTKWIIWANFLLLILQVYYFFFSNF